MMMTVAEFFERAQAAGLKSPAVIECQRWPGTEGNGEFELSMRNGQNDMLTAGDFGYHTVTLKFRVAGSQDHFQFNALCHGRKFWIE
jgi:hypothetical protein